MFQILPPKKFKKQLSQLILGLIIGFLLVFGGGFIKHIGWGQQPVYAQYLRPEFVADQVYQRLNYLPKENEYINKQTSKPDLDNTLISRLIRYHQDIMKRPTRFRIDWQLTLADYLGANQEIKEERYPGQATLTSNPMEADVKVVNSLNRRQRKELIDVLVSIYDIDPQQPSTSTPNPPTPQPGTNSVPPSNPTPTPPRKQPLSRPGDADLLAP